MVKCKAKQDGLLPGGKYFMVRGGTTLIAFRIPRGEPIGFMMSASHVDRPTFKITGDKELEGRYTRFFIAFSMGERERIAGNIDLCHLLRTVRAGKNTKPARI